MRGIASISRVVVTVTGLALGLTLGACARDPYVSADGETRNEEWWIAHQIDRITDAELPSASVFAGASNSNLKYPRVSSLLLTCLERTKPLVRFAFDFRIGTANNTALAYRFDDLPGREDVPIRVLKNAKEIVIEDRDVIARFVAELERAKSLYVRIRSIDGGRTAVEFPVKGAWAALRAAYAGCDMPAPAPLNPGEAKLPGIY